MKHFPEQDGPARGERATGIITALMLFLCIAAVAVFSYRRSLDPAIDLRESVLRLAGLEEREAKTAEVLHSFVFDIREKPDFTLYRGNIIKSSRSGILFLDKTGVIARSESIGFENPIARTNGSRILVVNAGGTEICVMDGESVRWQDRTDAAILNADISDDGYVAVITEAKRDNNVIRVYESHGVELFRKIIATDFAVSACISPSGKHLVLSSVATGAVGPFSRYKFYDMEGKELTEISFDSSGELLPLFWFNRDDSIFVAGDSAVAYIAPDGKTGWKEQFRSVAGAAPAGDGRLAVAAYVDEGAILNIYTAGGEKDVSVMLQGIPKGLDAVRGMVAVYTEDTVYFYDDRGTNTCIHYAGREILEVHLFDKRQAVVVTEGEITVIGME
ncbi:MAG TPA: DUF5711 family protein [Clostridiales bacterium]|nr:DUF5711 family protein [Clostridiales bacterium]HPV01044.1 DUF5711 family protein [Clostridiales bacterium]